MSNKGFKVKIIIYMFLFLFVAVAIDCNILGTTNKKQVHKTSQILLDQVDNILTANTINEKEILEELKIDYVSKAVAVAYILEHNAEAQQNIDELKKIADLMNVDEIHFFDEHGTIVNGTVKNYYGVSFDDGEQVGFFKPMLKDRNLTMCQDITPNTAEAKNMMYAITWDNTKTYMIQVGVEPVRLLEELKNNSIHEVVNQMPVYDGMNIYVADSRTGEIYGATDKSVIGKKVYDCGILNISDNPMTIKNKTVNLDGYRNYCYYKLHENYIIAVVHSTKVNLESFVVSITIEIVWLLISGSIIIYSLLKLANANKKINSQMSLLKSISDIYYSIHLIDMSDFRIEKLEGNELMDTVVREGQNAADMLERIVKSTLEKEYIESALKYTDLSTLQERMKGRKSIFMDAVDKNVGWLRMSFITVEADEDNVPTKVIIATQVIDEDKKREEELSIKAHKDELTGLFNRRAYENDLLIYPNVPPEQDFVYAAIDINGLKNVNDELGHAAGDEMIKGAAFCLKKTLGNYGKVYRTGGDEFVSIFFADQEHLDAVIQDLEKITNEWKGEIVQSLSLSVGYVTKKEFDSETVVNIAKIADQRMYQKKAEYYSRKGIDRRGQAAAHKALCNLYTKILKINLTEDTYTIVNMDTEEQTSDKGFSDKISDWFYGFGKTGQVHADDLEEYLHKTDINYLKEYFDQDKTSLTVFYRRKYGDIYKQVVMEMIPADDYGKDNQSLFLYVKSIDK